MIEIILMALVALSILGYHAYYVHENNKERKKMINALIAKNTDEMASLELADKTKIEVKKDNKEDLVPVEDLSDDEFRKRVLNAEE